MGTRIAADFVTVCYRKPDSGKLEKLLAEDVRMNDTMSSSPAKGKKDVMNIISNPFFRRENKIFPWRIDSVSYQPDHQNHSVIVEIEIKPVKSEKMRRSLILTHKLFFDKGKISRIESQYQKKYGLN